MKKILILLFFAVVGFSSCLVENTKIHLLNKKGKNIILLEENNNKIDLNTRLKERFGTENNNKDYVTVSLSINEFNFFKIKNFKINIFEKSNDVFYEISKGKIYYDEEMISYNESINIKNNITNLVFNSPSRLPIQTLLYIKTEESKRTFISNEFIIETNMSFVLNEKEYSIKKRDTLFRKVLKKHQLRVH